jgi:hypothetical protein
LAAAEAAAVVVAVPGKVVFGVWLVIGGFLVVGDWWLVIGGW